MCIQLRNNTRLYSLSMAGLRSFFLCLQRYIFFYIAGDMLPEVLQKATVSILPALDCKIAFGIVGIDFIDDVGQVRR